jgi:hypothetical protein
VPRDCIGAVIGSRGSVIKDVCIIVRQQNRTRKYDSIYFLQKIEQRTKARIRAKDQNLRGSNTANDKSQQQQQEDPNADRILVIRGSRVEVQRAELEIKRMLVDMPVTFTEKLFVPEYACGLIIGKGGANIKEMQSISSCRINLIDNLNQSDRNKISNELMAKANPSMLEAQAKNCSRNKPVVTINGSFEQIMQAKVRIVKILC